MRNRSAGSRAGRAARTLAGLALLAYTLSEAAGGGFTLFTAAEAQAWNNRDQDPAYAARELPQPGVPSCRSVRDSTGLGASDPKIDILAPTLDRPLNAPLDIELRFVSGGAAIRPETFRVCYVGFLTIDITKRITEHVAVSAQGLRVSGADLPRGHHHLQMLIADAQGHFGMRDAQFDIT